MKTGRQVNQSQPYDREAVCAMTNGYSQQVKGFKDLAKFIKTRFGLDDDDVEFPQEVRYAKSCGEWCGQEHSQALFSQLLRSFTTCAASVGAASAIPAQDAVLRITVVADNAEQALLYVLLAAASSQSGNHKPTQTFARLGQT